MKRKNIKEEIIELLFFVGSATREQITILLSESLKEVNGKLTGEKKDSVNKALNDLKKESYDIDKVVVGKNKKRVVKEYVKKSSGRVFFSNNFSNAKETYYLTPSQLQKIGFYENKKIDFNKNFDCVEYLIEKKIELEKKMNTKIYFKDYFNIYVTTNFNQINNLNEKIEEVDVVVEIPNDDEKEELHTFIYISGNVNDKFNSILKLSSNKKELYKDYTFSKTTFGYESNIYRIKLKELMERKL